MDLNIEEKWLNYLLEFLKPITSWISNSGDAEQDSILASIRNNQTGANNSPSPSKQEKKIYFTTLQLHPLKVNLSYASTPAHERSETR